MQVFFAGKDFWRKKLPQRDSGLFATVFHSLIQIIKGAFSGVFKISGDFNRFIV